MTPHDIEESLRVAQSCVHELAPVSMRLRGQFSMGTRTQWQQSPNLLMMLVQDTANFFNTAVATLEDAQARVYEIELVCFPHGVVIPLLSDSEAGLASALRSAKSGRRAFASVAPAILKACERGDAIVTLWKRLKRKERDALTATTLWFEAADPTYHHLASLISGIPVSAYTSTLQRLLSTPGAQDPITALGTWLRKVPVCMRECVQNMMPSASHPQDDIGIWITNFSVDASGDTQWIADNVNDGVVHQGYVLAVKTSLWKKFPESVNAIGKYLLAEKKHGSGWTRLAHDRLYPWAVPFTEKPYTYFALLPCTEPGKFRVRTKTWNLA